MRPMTTAEYDHTYITPANFINDREQGRKSCY